MAKRVLEVTQVPTVTYSIQDRRADVWAESMQLTAWETEVRPRARAEPAGAGRAARRLALGGSGRGVTWGRCWQQVAGARAGCSGGRAPADVWGLQMVGT